MGDPYGYVVEGRDTIDDIVISTATDLADAAPHRSVLALPAADQSALLAHLRQLDGTPEPNPSGTIFADSFENGSLSAWSSAVP